MSSNRSVLAVLTFAIGCNAEPTLTREASALGSQLTRLRASNDATNSYYGYSFSGAFDFHRVYLDTDESAATGFAHCGLGASYLIENTRLYAYTGDGSSWSWSQIATLAPVSDASSIAWTVARSAVGEAAFPNRAVMCFETEDAADVRDTSALYTHVSTDETLPIHAQVASNDATQLYYQATFDVAFSHKHVFIDADESVATGYTTGGVGADYMIENGTLYDYTGTGANWSWASLGSANMSPSTVGAIGVTTWSIARSAIGETAAAERAGLVFHGNPSAGGSSTYTAIYDHAYSGGTTADLVVDTGYAADPDPVLENPERGIYHGGTPGSGDYHTVVPAWLYLDGVCGTNLTWAGLGNASTSPVLNAYAQKLENYRLAGVKVLFRPRYDVQGSNAPSSCTINGYKLFHADSKTRQKNHIDAIAAMLGDYKDVVAFIQAGYFGRWGEWNTAGYAHENAPFLYSTADRAELVDYVIAKYAAEGVQPDLELRRPVLAKEVLDRNAAANVGLHNDCFMSNSSDYGTYSNFESGNPSNFASEAAAKTWAQAFTANASHGGETCPTDPTGPERWRSCSNMIGTSSEPGSLHTSYLNGDYANDAKATWIAGGCYDEIRRRLGYRFEVTRVAYTPTAAAGQPFTVQVDVKNTGWARMHRPRQAKLVLRNGSTTHVFALSAGGVASWAPGAATQLSVTAPAPASGTYSVRLWIPDPDAPTGSTYASTRIAYAVKIATLRGGAAVFDGTTGENNLGVSFVVP